MAIDIDSSFYRTGTATVAANGTTVTGQGTSWQTALRAGDMFGTHVGDGVRILSVNSNTSLTLAWPWKGPAQTAAGYEVQLTLQAIGYQKAVRELLQLLTNGNLDAFAGLSKENNQFIVMGASGDIGKKPIADVTNAIAQKYTLPAGGANSQLIDGTGALTTKSGLPISTAVQSALNAKANLYGGNTFDGAQRFSAPSDFRVGSWGTEVSILNFGWSTEGRSWSLAQSPNEDLTFLKFNLSTGVYYSTPVVIKPTGLTVNGSLSKASGTFLIDHPLDPLNKNLRHGFVEAPEYLNIYRGTVRLVNGRATVNIDDYFDMMQGTFWALNTDVIVSSLQNQDGFSRVRPDGKMTDGTLNIICEDEACNDEVAWMVTGRRKDAYVLHLDPNCERGTGRFISEIEKED